MKLIIKLLTITILASLIGCANIAGKPSAAENDWAKFKMAGFNLGWSKRKNAVSFQWQFIISVKNVDIKQVYIYDITESTEKLLIDDKSVLINDGNWLGNTQFIDIKKNGNHWVFSNDEIQKKFKAILIDSNGHTREMIQNTVHPAKERKLMLMTLG